MSVLTPDDAGAPGDDPGAGKRKGKAKLHHTVGKVVGATMVVIALVTGLTVVFVYRHYNSNLNVVDLGQELGSNRPERKIPAGPDGPINILVMGSDNRDAPGDHIDNLSGIGKRSDTTILLHLSGDRHHAYGVSIPRDSVVDSVKAPAADSVKAPKADSTPSPTGTKAPTKVAAPVKGRRDSATVDCARLLERVSLGEKLTESEQATLNARCRR